MPRQRIDYRRISYAFPDDFPKQLERFGQESGLSWTEDPWRNSGHDGC